MSNRQENYVRFWGMFADAMRDKGQTWTSAESSRRLWMAFPTGTTLAKYAVALTQKYAKVEIYLSKGSHEENIQRLEKLRHYQARLEQAVGTPMSWEPLPHAKASRVAIYKEADFKDEANWPEEIDWMVTKLIALRDAVEELGGMPHLLSE